MIIFSSVIGCRIAKGHRNVTKERGTMAQDLERNGAGLPIRELGKTGLKVSIVGFGGGHYIRSDINEQTSVRLVQNAIDEGMTFMDTAWEYGQGESERRMGLALKGRRDQVTLMTKVCGRDAKTAEEQLHQSLRRLQTEVIDVWQFHEINYDNDPDLIFRVNGAIDTALAARAAGKIRFIGFTGHKSPHILKKMLDQDFDWDTCQLPINVLDAHYRSFQNEILPELNHRDIGVIGMKSLGGRGQLITALGLSAAQCRGYALSLPISTLSCGIDSLENLQQDLEIAHNFSPMSLEEQRALLSSVSEEAGDGRHEWFKSTQYYDSQYHRDQHGFPPIN
ncbi:MAG: aldo/keto reductase [Candidatus Poribacteria bacterium]|nr:aldo/keto reductase [Candidatus Poribacteria bacterium]